MFPPQSRTHVWPAGVTRLGSGRRLKSHHCFTFARLIDTRTYFSRLIQ